MAEAQTDQDRLSMSQNVPIAWLRSKLKEINDDMLKRGARGYGLDKRGRRGR